ncbi:DNA-3-methyladenine glycosylase I [Marinilongibacter aquaticus]|uniref:DNA-3-methyladenine glycosylase I n=1 Tax=Marinilongibacter aquaticus TaxID=2975157 RepID=UPI0021BDE561|nr:DNA-3-methyladenine glycosylase I [Marinilongibacter aquaticus]UBM58538.1 DNA-3-methyladenine glycosylase I [Marinilongibacter aquaticus]
MSYCNFCKSLPEDNVHRIYHDQFYGHPIEDDQALFERLVLEINQAGLSWDTILKKQEGFKEAYDAFDIEVVAGYGESDFERLLQDARIIRNRLKINAAIYNAQRILELQKEFGSFKNWICEHYPLEKQEWVKLFKKNFKFVGGEIVNEFLQSSGYLPTPHDADCPVHEEIENLKNRFDYGTS